MFEESVQSVSAQLLNAVLVEAVLQLDLSGESYVFGPDSTL
jgi:hypothetical protein